MADFEKKSIFPFHKEPLFYKKYFDDIMIFPQNVVLLCITFVLLVSLHEGENTVIGFIEMACYFHSIWHILLLFRISIDRMQLNLFIKNTIASKEWPM